MKGACCRTLKAGGRSRWPSPRCACHPATSRYMAGRAPMHRPGTACRKPRAFFTGIAFSVTRHDSWCRPCKATLVKIGALQGSQSHGRRNHDGAWRTGQVPPRWPPGRSCLACDGSEVAPSACRTAQPLSIRHASVHQGNGRQRLARSRVPTRSWQGGTIVIAPSRHGQTPAETGLRRPITVKLKKGNFRRHQGQVGYQVMHRN